MIMMMRGSAKTALRHKCMSARMLATSYVFMFLFFSPFVLGVVSDFFLFCLLLGLRRFLSWKTILGVVCIHSFLYYAECFQKILGLGASIGLNFVSCVLYYISAYVGLVIILLFQLLLASMVVRKRGVPKHIVP